MPHPGSIRLRGIAWNHPRAMGPLLGTLPAYRQLRPEVEIQWEPRSLRAFGDQPLEELAEQFDLLLIDHPFVGQADRTGCLRPFDDLVPASYLRGLAEASIGPSFRSYTWNDRQWALPIDAATQVAAHRPDLLAADAPPPATWIEVLDLARRLRTNGRWMALPLGPTDLVPTLYTLSNSLGVAPFGDRERVVPRAHGLRVLDLLEELRAASPPDATRLDPPPLLERMARGDEIAYAPILFGYSNYARSGFRPHVVRFGDLPGVDRGPDGSTLGGVGIAVSASSTRSEESAQYAVWLTAGELQRTSYVERGGQPAHRAAWLDRAADDACGGFFTATARTQVGAWVRPRFPGYNSFQERAGGILHAFVRGAAGATETLDSLDEAYRNAIAGWSGPIGADTTIGVPNRSGPGRSSRVPRG